MALRSVFAVLAMCVLLHASVRADPVTVCKNVAWNAEGTRFSWKQLRIAQHGCEGFLRHFPSYIACEGPCPCPPRPVVACSLSHVLYDNGTLAFSVSSNSTDVLGYRWALSNRRRHYMTRDPSLVLPEIGEGVFTAVVTVVDEFGNHCVTNDTVNTHGDACPSDPNKTDPGLCGCGVSDNLIGHPCGTGGLGVCAVGVIQCSHGYQYCEQATNASPEVCDGLDNDCNGVVDDNISSDACGSDVGVCSPGTTQCIAGSTVCQNSVGPSVELCNGLDDDCDGIVDNVVPEACGSDVGTCSMGMTQCSNGATECVGSVGPVAEVCDGLDNDCDGVVDNNIAPVACGSSIGQCQSGMTQCTAGTTVCDGGVGPVPETCDGLDNDCNGLVDDGIQSVQCGVSDVGACQFGMSQCSNGNEVCVGSVDPTNELCNGVDDNCDGTVDEGFNVGAVCTAYATTSCTEGTLVCSQDGLSSVCTGASHSCADFNATCGTIATACGQLVCGPVCTATSSGGPVQTSSGPGGP